MPLTPGTTLGCYSVTAKIGEGGMRQVYQGTARLNRHQDAVAVREIPIELSAPSG